MWREARIQITTQLQENIVTLALALFALLILLVLGGPMGCSSIARPLPVGNRGFADRQLDSLEH